eukprot:3750803-Rhodomonas_salina.4
MPGDAEVAYDAQQARVNVVVEFHTLRVQAVSEVSRRRCVASLRLCAPPSSSRQWFSSSSSSSSLSSSLSSSYRQSSSLPSSQPSPPSNAAAPRHWQHQTDHT